MHTLPRSAQRVQAAAVTLGLSISVREMPESTRTAEEAAAACQCDVAQIVKSLVFRGRDSGDPYLLLVLGANRVNEKRAAATLGEKLERPDADFVREVTGYSIGGIPPFGHAREIASFMDRDLMEHETIWAAAGTPKCLFSVDPVALQKATAASAIDVK